MAAGTSLRSLVKRLMLNRGVVSTCHVGTCNRGVVAHANLNHCTVRQKSRLRRPLFCLHRKVPRRMRNGEVLKQPVLLPYMWSVRVMVVQTKAPVSRLYHCTCST